jgi:hypothetical protein
MLGSSARKSTVAATARRERRADSDMAPRTAALETKSVRDIGISAEPVPIHRPAPHLYEELDRVLVIERVIEKRLTQAEAARILGVPTRQARRLRRAYERDGARALASKRRGRASHRRLPPIGPVRPVGDTPSPPYGALGTPPGRTTAPPAR